MAKAKRSGDNAHRGVAEVLCEKICREYRNKDKFDAIKSSKEYGYEKEVVEIVEEMSSCQACDESVSPERMKLASEIKEVLEQRRLHKEDGGKNYLTPNHKEVGPVPFFLSPLSAPHLVAPRLLAAVGEVPHDGDAPAGDQGDGGGTPKDSCASERYWRRNIKSE